MKKLLIFSLIFFVGLASAYANDSAVESAAGGLQLRKERSVLMEKERLFISEKLVKVEYEFRNTSSKSVSSEVAFPISPYEVKYEDLDRDFKDFKVWVDGKLIEVNVEAKAYVKGREVTEDISNAGIKLKEFGGLLAEEKEKVLNSIKPNLLRRLTKLGALKEVKYSDDIYWEMEWETHIKYYWHQEFPPGKIVHIKHEYYPVCGYEPETVNDITSDLCLDKETRKEIEKRVAVVAVARPDEGGYFYPAWVDYILTTANSWQTPIKDFELIIQGNKDELVTFCWDGPVEKIDENRFRANEKNFVPKKDLRVYFIKFGE